MFINVIVCTYNRCQLLSKALQSIVESKVPSSAEWEILVVDNNSSDQTCHVVADFSGRYPGRFRYHLEPQQGLSAARNAGVRMSRGEVLAFTDDDVVVEPDWLWNLTATLGSGEWAGAGGRIVPVWPGVPPRWMPSNILVLGPIVAFDLGRVAVPLNEAPIGANMAFRREAFEKHGDFRTDLGRCGDSLRNGEDSEFGWRLLGAGERLRYEPAAVVHHPVPEDRLRKEYLLSWFFENGRSSVVTSGIPGEGTWSLAGVPIRLFRRLARWSVQWAISIKPSDRFSCKSKVWGIAGTILECYQLSRRGGRTGRRSEPSSGSVL
jgi:glycosyltransferase involved in cell wall biosynthesis